MKELIVYLVKSGTCLTIFLLVYQIFLRKNTFFRFNRGYLFFGLIISFIIPLFAYSYDIYIPVGQSIISVDEISNEPVSIISDLNIWQIFSYIYIAGILVVLIHNILLIRKLFSKIKASGKTKVHNYKLIDNDEINAPFSVGNYIMINTQKLSEKERELILKHEIAHIDQKHWIDLLCSQILLITQWFNPIAWKYVKIQKENHEFLADKAVIDTGISPALYRAVLINQQFRGPIFSFSNSFNYSNSLNRLAMITKTKSSPWKKVMVLTILPLFSIFIWVSAKPKIVFVNDDPPAPVVQNNEGVSLSIASTISGLESNVDLSKYLILIGNKISTIEEVKKLKGSGNYVFGIVEGEQAVKMHGEKAKNGVVAITTVGDEVLYNDNTSEVVIGMEQQDALGLPENMLIIIDGKESSKADMNRLNPDNIDSIDILKDKKYIAKYGAKAKEGVIIIKTRKKK